jgi:predicted Co/Zn/Cd cation transporter (cation efflux family)
MSRGDKVVNGFGRLVNFIVATILLVLAIYGYKYAAHHHDTKSWIMAGGLTLFSLVGFRRAFS